MINYEHFQLDNGLQVYVHEDHDTPIAVVNILYNVGSRDENENKTGFAHLFEHLMFGGSKNITNFDEPLQAVGGENNAFTSADITNYYVSLPAQNIETAFWLESDRMLSLSFEDKVLEVQRNVVIEEFKQRYLNQPYGDVWLKLRPLAYQKHPYKWPTIGKEIKHIEEATMDDVKDFFYKFYRPNNAVMVVGGNVKVDEIKKLAKKWFEPIEAGEKYVRVLPKEPLQQAERRSDVEANVPMSAIYKAYHMPDRLSPDYHAADLANDVLGRGKSSRLYKSLVKEKKIFNSIGAYITGSIDPGLMIVQGKINNGINPEEANKAIEEEVDNFVNGQIAGDEFEKVKNQATTSLVFGEVDLLNRAMELAFFANMGDASLVNQELSKLDAVKKDHALAMGKKILTKENCSTLFYHAKNN